ncbi:hypothetical protein AB0D13_39575 [Streptomyces sp. NPDC048430]|uniref:hypothetical protein n=1 Tax=Streptomyces sp. NPDC048430 TaxID=3155388 RepID=UPI00343081B0
MDERSMREGMLMQGTRQPTHQGSHSVWRRIGRCAAMYLLVYSTAWVIIALMFPWEGESFFQTIQTSLILLGLVGIPSILLAVLAGLAHRKMEVPLFRGALVLPMLFFTWPLLASSSSEPLLIQILAQLAFVVWLMPAPLLPEKWVGPS